MKRKYIKLTVVGLLLLIALFTIWRYQSYRKSKENDPKLIPKTYSAKVTGQLSTDLANGACTDDQLKTLTASAASAQANDKALQLEQLSACYNFRRNTAKALETARAAAQAYKQTDNQAGLERVNNTVSALEDQTSSPPNTEVDPPN